MEFKLIREEPGYGGTGVPEELPGYGRPAAGVPGVTAGVRPPPLEGVRDTAARLFAVPCTGVPGTVRIPDL